MGIYFSWSNSLIPRSGIVESNGTLHLVVRNFHAVVLFAFLSTIKVVYYFHPLETAAEKERQTDLTYICCTFQMSVTIRVGPGQKQGLRISTSSLIWKAEIQALEPSSAKSHDAILESWIRSRGTGGLNQDSFIWNAHILSSNLTHCAVMSAPLPF